MRKIGKISGIELLRVAFILMLLWCTFALNAQTDKKFIRQGNREYNKNNYSDSEISYRKASDKNTQSADAIFNIGDALYKQNKFEEAGKQFTENISKNDDKAKKSAGYYNLGNSLLKANKVEESIEAYKNSLKLNPASSETKYNLAYAQDLLKQQQQQKKDQEKQDKENQDKKDDKKNDQQKDQDKDKQDQKNDQNNKDQQQQQQQQGMSKDDAQRLLNALANDEKKVQEKVKLAKAAKSKVRTVKNW
jgi:Ca-activated chloride channel family protein